MSSKQGMKSKNNDWSVLIYRLKAQS
jgi:hypothetical protein